MGEYQRATGIFYQSELETIKRSKNLFQFIFEAFTNSFESLEKSGKQGVVSIKIYSSERPIRSENEEFYDFNKVVVTDNGIGFNDEEYDRFLRLRDDRKGPNNKGTGRIQYLHFFDKTIIESVYRDENSSTGFYERKMTLSKSPAFIDKNAIIYQNSREEVQTQDETTKIIFKDFLDNSDKEDFEKNNIQKIKESLISHYLYKFCDQRDALPEINIIQYIDQSERESLSIKVNDIPKPTQEKTIDISYSEVKGGRVTQISEKEEFKLKAFTIPSQNLEENSLKLISKGEEATKVKLSLLKKTDIIKGNRYLFLLSSKYIDKIDGDDRGDIKIITEKELLKRDKNEFFPTKEITIDSIENKTHETITLLFSEIKEKNEEKNKNLKDLQDMFLFNDETFNAIKDSIKVNDSDTEILKKFHIADAKITSQGDAKINEQMKSLDNLDTTKDDYQETLMSKVDELVKQIPLQNRTTLARYVARRKIVLELFEKIIDEQLSIQKSLRKKIDEKLLHNLIFQQSSGNPESSDLWLINEDFIYFKGASEDQLGKISLDDKAIIKDDLSEEEERYRLKQGGDAKQKRPDILLFPKEEKCIIIEFKSLDINASYHLNQINRYASLINNLSKDTYNFTTYYGYLIGENIDTDDIQDNDSDYISAQHLDFIYRPYKRIIGKFGKKDGSLYTEILKYSTLLKRAKIRNKVFIDKLDESDTDSE